MPLQLNQSDLDLNFMRRALQWAKQAAARHEIPVGAVVVVNNQIIAHGYNQAIVRHDATAHAEILALRQAARRLQNYRLPPQTTLYVTLEPCAMCVGALVHFRVDRLVFGTTDPKSGAICTKIALLDYPLFNHQCRCTSGILAEESGTLLTNFFAQLRAKKRNAA